MANHMDPTDPATWLYVIEAMARLHKMTGRPYRVYRRGGLTGLRGDDG